jgi:hypothetical protein
MVQEGELSGELFSSQWFAFADDNGRGLAQADHFVVGEAVLLFECKLTQNPSADFQLRHLYGPILEAIYEKEVLKVQVCKNLRFDPGPLEIQHPVERLHDRDHDILVWHYLG